VLSPSVERGNKKMHILCRFQTVSCQHTYKASRCCWHSRTYKNKKADKKATWQGKESNRIDQVGVRIVSQLKMKQYVHIMNCVDYISIMMTKTAVERTEKHLRNTAGSINDCQQNRRTRHHRGSHDAQTKRKQTNK
jgi:hypothetical protein